MVKRPEIRGRRIRRSLRTAPPEPRAAIDHDAADRIDGGERADGVAIRRFGRGGTDAAFVIDRGGAGAGADAAQREFGCSRGGGGVAEIAIRRKPAPILVAAAQQIEQHGRRHDRHPRGAHRKAAALLAQPGLRARRGIEAEGRAAGQHDGVDALDRPCRIEQRGFARSRARRRARRSRRQRVRRKRPRSSPSRGAGRCRGRLLCRERR